MTLQFPEILMGLSAFLDQLSPEQNNHLTRKESHLNRMVFKAVTEQFSRKHEIDRNTCSQGFVRDNSKETLILWDLTHTPSFQWIANCNPIDLNL